MKSGLFGVCLLVLLTACKHTETQVQYSALEPAHSQDAASATSSPAARSPETSPMAAISPQPVALASKLDPGWLQPPSDPFTLGPGDRLEIEVIGDATSKTTTIVGPDGKIYFGILPGIDVWGATLTQAKALIEDGLSKYVREKPQVTIVLRGIESKRIWVLGRVQAP